LDGGAQIANLQHLAVNSAQIHLFVKRFANGIPANFHCPGISPLKSLLFYPVLIFETELLLLTGKGRLVENFGVGIESQLELGTDGFFGYFHEILDIAMNGYPTKCRRTLSFEFGTSDLSKNNDEESALR